MALFMLIGYKPTSRHRDSWSVIRNRMECAANIAIFDGLCKQPFPDGALKMVRRQLNQVGGGEVGFFYE